MAALEEWRALQKLSSTHIILWNDSLYPTTLRQLPDAPPVLYCKGDLSLLSAPAVAVVGSRNCTSEGVRVAGRIARQLAACGVTIISGMAQGIDTVAHGAALHEAGRSIGVLGTGIDVIYPVKNTDIFGEMEERGLLVTEFPPGSKPIAGNFPIRNRIISGLALGVLVVEASHRSGSLITARLALEQNREVYAIPGPTFAPSSLGCQELVRQGAHPVFSAEDILLDMAALLATYGIEQQAALASARALEGEGKAGISGLPEKHTVPSSAGERPAKNTGAPAPTSQPIPFSASVGDIPADLDKDAAAVLRTLGMEPLHVDAICANAALPPFRVSALLTQLEVDGHVRRHAGARYTRLHEDAHEE